MVIKTVSKKQSKIIKNIIKLYCPYGIDADVTYSKGAFYKNTGVKKPWFKSDLYPCVKGVKKYDAANLHDVPLKSFRSIIYDPPFLAVYTKRKPTGKMGQRFHGFSYVPKMWEWYSACLKEFYRIMRRGGVLIVKCQDTVSSGIQYLSHVHIINEAEKLGFYTKDIFILVADKRLVGHNHKKQKHARKFHSYFIVFIK